MPMLGAAISAVIVSASGSTMPSSTTAKAPASLTALASARMRSRAESSWPWLRKPPMAFTAWGVRPTWAITGMPRSTRKAMVGAMCWPPSSLIAPQPVSAITVAAERKASCGLVS